ncbi:minichromosome maintenance protein MCM, partial [archaeon]
MDHFTSCPRPSLAGLQTAGLRMAMMSEHSAAREMEARPVKARVFNLRDVKRMRDLDPIDIDTLVCIRGMVIRTSSPIPEMHVALFRCAFCRNSMAVTVDRGHVEEPMLCTMCKKKKVFELIHNRYAAAAIAPVPHVTLAHTAACLLAVCSTLCCVRACRC